MSSSVAAIAPARHRLLRMPFSMQRGAIDYWPFVVQGAVSGNSVLYSGLGPHDLTQSGTPTVGTGPSANLPALVWDATTSNYATAADVPALSLQQKEWSVLVWVKLADISVQRAVCGKYLSTGDQRGWGIDYNAVATNFEFRYSTAGTSGTVTVKSFPGTQGTNVWYLLAARYQSGSLYLGVNAGGPTAVALASFFNAVTPFVVGGNSTLGSASGSIAGLYITPRFVTDAEVRAYYNNGRGIHLLRGV